MTKMSGTIDVSGFTTDAKFRNWGSTCSTALQACGLVLTSDTGQINWTTVSKPTAINTKAGYEIYRFADTLQATKPVFIRIDYGSGTVASGNGPSTWITVGTGSNGSGTITGPQVGPLQSGYNGATAPSNVAMLYQFTHSLAPGVAVLNFGMELVAATARTPGIFIIERSKNAAGAATGDAVGLTIATVAATVGWGDFGINFNNSTAYATQRTVHCGFPALSNSLTFGTAVAVYPHLIEAGALFYASARVSHFSGDISGGSTNTMTPLGAVSHSYFTWGLSTGGDSSGQPSSILDWLWED